MIILKSLDEFLEWRAEIGEQTLGLVPTMGALHDGHLSLVEASLQKSDVTLAYIFVNPAQFAAHEDLDTYPQTLDADIEKLKTTGCDALWIPSAEDIYPGGDMSSDIEPASVAYPLEGEHRPHFFKGVVNVLSRFFDHVKPDFVFMGEKDYQQLLVVQHMVKEYEIDIEIIGVPTVRDDNGLALSSRNAYLNESEYDVAIHLNRILFVMAEKIRSGQDVKIVKADALVDLQNAGFDKIDYCAIRDAHNLQHATHGSLRILAAVIIGQTRLIDNVPV
ncbi:MAG: pantoate--beta-alanine ligase [Pseudomonadota bacterium]